MEKRKTGIAKRAVEMEAKDAKLDSSIRLQALGFDSEREYQLYLQIKEALKQKIVIGIAS